MKELFELYKLFFKIGAFTFGGGLAMLPMLQSEIVENKGFATEEELMDYYSIGQCTPGIIAVNTATFIGYRQKGTLGALFSTLGIVSPSLIIILIIANFIKEYTKLAFIQNIFNGIKIAVAGLLTKSVITLFKANIKDRFCKIIFLLFLILGLFLNLSAIYTVILCIIISICLSFFKKGEPSK